MFSRNRFLAGASAVALAASATLGGAGIAGAQGSSEIAADLGLAATALNGPVAVVGNAEGGPTVTYVNKTGAEQTCVGFTLPYSTVDAAGIDPSGLDLSDLGAALGLIAAIEAAGGVSVLGVNAEGDPVANTSAPGSDVAAAAIGLLGGVGVTVPEDGTVEWDATLPETPAAAVVLCVPDPDAGLLAVNFGIDKQVVVDQLNGTLPGGSIGAGSVSGGSVATGASLLGSLGGGDDAGADVDVDVDLEANSGSAGSGADADAELDVNALTAN